MPLHTGPEYMDERRAEILKRELGRRTNKQNEHKEMGVWCYLNTK